MSLPTDLLLEKLIELFVNRKKKRNEQETIEIVRIFPKYGNHIYDTIFEIYREKKLITKWKKAKKRPKNAEKIKSDIEKDVREYGNYIFQITHKYLTAIEHSITGITPLDLLNETQEHILKNLEGWLNLSLEIDDPYEKIPWEEILNIAESEFLKYWSTRQSEDIFYPTLPDIMYYSVSKRVQQPKTEEDYFGVVFIYMNYIHFRGTRLTIPLEYIRKIPSQSNALQNQYIAKEGPNVLRNFYKFYDMLGTQHIPRMDIFDLMVKLTTQENPNVRDRITKILDKEYFVKSPHNRGISIDEDFEKYLIEGTSTSSRLYILRRLLEFEPQLSDYRSHINSTFKHIVEILITLIKDKDPEVNQKARDFLNKLKENIPKNPRIKDPFGNRAFLEKKLQEHKIS